MKNGRVPIQPDTDEPFQELEPPPWTVREAQRDDVPTIAAGVGELLVELGGTPAEPEALEEAAEGLIEDPDAGIVLVAELNARVVGVLSVSWQSAIRIPGRYGLIQELWVHPTWRGMAIGSDLMLALFDCARERGIARLEVGLPSERFPHLAATEAFYVNNDFTPIGLRMRRLLL